MSIADELGKKPELMPPLTLAYIGDVVYEIYVRTRTLAENPDLPTGKLHNKSIRYVKAQAQCRSIQAMTDMLTDEEMSVYKRGRNAKSASSAKNASLIEYKHATGFEALVGYLYLKGENERLDEIMKRAYEINAQNE